MDATIAKKWTAKLRSGEIKQCRWSISVDGCMCATGVLCDVVGAVVREHDALMSTEAMAAAGISRSGAAAVMDLNDSKRWTFHQIADWIDEHFGEL